MGQTLDRFLGDFLNLLISGFELLRKLRILIREVFRDFFQRLRM